MLAKALTWLPERFDEVRGLSERALTIAKQCGDVATEILAAAELGNALTHLGDGRRGSALLEDAVERARRLDDNHVLVTVLSRQAGTAVSCGDFVRAKALFVEAQHLAHEFGAQRKVADAQGGDPAGGPAERELPVHTRLDPTVIAGVAVGALRQCDFAFARAGRDEILTLASAMADPLRECRILIALGYADLRASELERAAASLQRASSIVSTYHLPVMQAEVLDNLGLVLLAHGELNEAGSHMRESLIMRRRIGSVLQVVYSLCSLATLLARGGQAREAAIIATAARQACAIHGLVLDEGTQAALEEALPAAHASLRADEAQCAGPEGEALDLDDAVKLALAA
jgi:ATP/maltotriose-dependent transcriptional regulator MalT